MGNLPTRRLLNITSSHKNERIKGGIGIKEPYQKLPVNHNGKCNDCLLKFIAWMDEYNELSWDHTIQYGNICVYLKKYKRNLRTSITLIPRQLKKN